MSSESKSWGLRLRDVRKQLDLNQDDFAAKLHITRSYLSELENDRRPFQPWLTEKIEELERQNVDSGDTLKDSKVSYKSGNASEVMMLTELAPHKVPVVSWARAGAGISYHDLAEQLDEYVLSDAPDPNAYALIIEGDSMEPEFKAGDRVIFLPNQEARNGDIVVARVEETGEVYFKLFHTFGTRNEKVRLTSYNTVYPVLEFERKEFRFIHPMHSMWRKRRR